MQVTEAISRCVNDAATYGGNWYVHIHDTTKNLLITERPCPQGWETVYEAFSHDKEESNVRG